VEDTHFVNRLPFTMKLVLLASVVASAAAFAPSQSSARTSVATNAYSESIGVTEPLGFYDPLNFLKDGDAAKFQRLRYVELKHGRIAMLAVVGYIATACGNRLPGDLTLSGVKFADIPAGFASLSAIPKAGILQLLFFIGVLETSFMRDWVGGESPGDFRNNYIDFGWDTFSDERKTREYNVELAQGRAAQMGILGLMVHEQLGNVDDILPFKLV
jgi:Chlorophyll A-B binding protein